jgi:hypothetical protein
MKMFTQNLTECSCGKPVGSMFWLGRAHVGNKRRVKVEWCFLKFARSFHFKIEFGAGEGEDGIMLVAGVPFLFDLYFTVEGVRRVKTPFQTGIAIHNQCFWFYPLSWTDESNSKDPWWRKAQSWAFPWSYDWYSTEILEHKANLPALASRVWMERGYGKNKVVEKWVTDGTREGAEKFVSETYNYHYRTKDGKHQNVKATVHVNRMTWRMRWWPLLPFKKVSTSISVNFDQEVGEGRGSWKGGCVGCGYEMKFGETPLETLRRMENERRFDR